MPRKASGNFNQIKYNNEWKKANMKEIKVAYKTAFVEEFKEACRKLGVSQSSVIKEKMEEVIEKASHLD